MYESCGKTSKGPKWCYVFESDQMCPQAMRTEHGGQHWDYCFTEDLAAGPSSERRRKEEEEEDKNKKKKKKKKKKQ